MKKKVLAVILAVCIICLVGSTIYEKVSYSNLSFEEKILEIMNCDEMSGTKYVDSVVLLTEVDGGYFCVATASSDETVHFGYIREENGELEFAGKSFSSLSLIVNNEDPIEFLRTSILNFSEKDYYYSCYQHKDDIKIMVNDTEAEIHNFTLSYLGEEYNMDLWFVCSENEPIVKSVTEK